MANKKITDLVEITSAANVDVLPIVDVSADVTNKIQVANLPINTATQTALDAKQATLVSGTNIKTINSTSLLGSGDIAIAANPAGTAGQIQFTDGSAFAADSNLYWDNTNKRLGVGTSSTARTVDIVGTFRNVWNNTWGIDADGNNVTFSAFSKHTFKNWSNSGLKTTLVIQGSGTNGEIGVNTATPTAQLQVKGSGSTSATTSLLVQNSSGTELLKVADNGKIFLGSNITGQEVEIAGQSYFDLRLKESTSGSTTRLYKTSGTFYLIESSSGSNFTYGYAANYWMSWKNSTKSLAISSTVSDPTPNASAVVDLDSTTKGFLPPRMTTTQKNAISSPAAGLQVYDSTTNRAAVYTSAWENVITETNGSPNSVYKLWSGSAAQYAALTPDSSTLYFVI